MVTDIVETMTSFCLRRPVSPNVFPQCKCKGVFESDQDDFFFVQLGKLYLLMMTKGKYVRMH